MLVFLSDLHFVDGTAGAHNLPLEAFKILFADLQAQIKDPQKNIQEIKFVLLGDIIDLLRSERWLADDCPLAERPWGDAGAKDVPTPHPQSPTEKRCLEILLGEPQWGPLQPGPLSPAALSQQTKPAGLKPQTILGQNWETFYYFRNFKDIYQIELPVEIIYVPGNHDRLVNLYPSLRDALGRILGAHAISGWYEHHFQDPDYGVFARHGHQFDLWNYGGGSDLTRTGQLQIPIGDVFTTEFAVKIPWLFQKLYGQTYPEMAANLRDIDNVRPLSAILEWIYYRLKVSGGAKKALDEVFDRVIKDLLDLDFVQKWRSPATKWDEVLRTLSSNWLRWLPKSIVDLIQGEDLLGMFLGVSEFLDRPEEDPLVKAAYYEQIWSADPRYNLILYGHTHAPLHLPLDVVDGKREVAYINTGTWRPRIKRTVTWDRAHDFVEYKHMTYVLCYRPEEDTRNKQTGTPSFEIWTGAKYKKYR